MPSQKSSIITLPKLKFTSKDVSNNAAPAWCAA